MRAHTNDMRLTDTTEIKLLASTRYLAVYEFAGDKKVSEAAKILAITSPSVFRCSWMVEAGRTEDGDTIIRDCDAMAVEFDNGWACLNGHTHYTYGGQDHAEYYTEDEMEHCIQSGHALHPNARLV